MNSKTVQVKKVIEVPDFVAIFEVPATVVLELPDDPLLSPQTLRMLDEARKRAAAGDHVWLRDHGARLFFRAVA